MSKPVVLRKSPAAEMLGNGAAEQKTASGKKPLPEMHRKESLRQKTLTVSMPRGLLARIDRAAKERNMTRSAVCQEIFERYV